ncbi:MAG TPA: AraC family transcriptional regulator [Steroidobacteraceae bacterium]
MLPDHPSDPVRKALRLKAEQGVAGTASARLIAEGPGWKVKDIICSSGPKDRPFEERHTWASVAVVLSGSFSYGNDLGRNLLTPGSLLLGGPGGCFTCGHEHGEGDRCLAFHFEPSFFEGIAAAAGARGMDFGLNSLPALRGLAPLVARSVVAAQEADSARRPEASEGSTPSTSFEELALELAGAALNESAGYRPQPISRRDERRVGAVARFMEERFVEPCALSDLARLAGLSPYHFLRVFRATTGLTPHQHLLRTRLRAAASNLARSMAPVTEIALAAGFEDLSNFTRTFRAEYRLSPLQYRAQFHRPAVKSKDAPSGVCLAGACQADSNCARTDASTSRPTWR